MQALQLEAPQFSGFPKMARLSRRAVITEKIDGTNAQIYIVPRPVIGSDISGVTAVTDTHLLYAGSRNRWLTPENDNFGFAAWVRQNAEELQQLGAGRHFGEWWGSGIQRGYGYKKGERFFSLFNAVRWVPSNKLLGFIPTLDPRAEPVLQQHAPACCRVVPVLYDGPFCTQIVEDCMGALRAGGSIAEPGFLSPEGLVVYHVAAGVGFKKTLDGDEAKGVTAMSTPTPITDDASRNADAFESPAKAREFTRRLELDRSALMEAVDTLTLVIGLTPIKGNLEALQEAHDQARTALAAARANFPEP